MDAHDLFKQLTRGVKFTKKRKTANEQLYSKEVKYETKNKSQEINSIETKLQDQLLLRLEDEKEEKETSGNFEYLKADGKHILEPKKKKKKDMVPEDPVEKQNRIEHDRIVKLRLENQISIFGKNIPSPIESFAELHTRYNVSDRLIKNLVADYVQPTAVQMQAIPIMLERRALMACAPTGSGKTIAFLTPIINDLRGPQKLGFRAMVLAPTRELAQQIYRECTRLCEKFGLKVHIVSKVHQKSGAEMSKRLDILISTPNRVRYLLQQEPPLLNLKHIEWLVIDEADRLLEEKEKDSFKDQLDDILVACTNPNKKIALFSATYTVPVAKWALKNLKKLARVNVGYLNAATDSVEQELLFVGSESGKLLAMRNMVHEGLMPPVLVFVQSKDRAKQLFEELLYDGINVDVIHADRTQQQRDNCVRAFREGNIWVLICTELMSRGIDFKGVNLVINYDFPPSTISYVHRIGRSGRAGRTGRAVTFFTQDDTPHLRNIAEIIRNSGGKVPYFMLNMKKRTKTKKMLKEHAPKRDQISTKIQPEATTTSVTEDRKLNKVKRVEHALLKRNEKNNDRNFNKKNWRNKEV